MDELSKIGMAQYAKPVITAVTAAGKAVAPLVTSTAKNPTVQAVGTQAAMSAVSKPRQSTGTPQGTVPQPGQGPVQSQGTRKGVVSGRSL